MAVGQQHEDRLLDNLMWLRRTQPNHVVEHNKAGNPLELQTIVEFLNEQMSIAEVVAIEGCQWLGSGQQVLVPRVVGWIATAQPR